MPIPGVALAIGGGLAKKGLGWLTKKVTKKAAKKVIVASVGAVAIDKAVGRIGAGGKIAFPQNISPFEPGRGVFGKGGGGGGRISAGEMGACPSGYHLNKHPLSDGTPARSVCVRNRSINYANGRAASRAGRRLHGTIKMLKRSFSLVHGAAPKGKFIPKKRK